jgi:hypothetical protein
MSEKVPWERCPALRPARATNQRELANLTQIDTCQKTRAFLVAEQATQEHRHQWRDEHRKNEERRKRGERLIKPFEAELQANTGEEDDSEEILQGFTREIISIL